MAISGLQPDDIKRGLNRMTATAAFSKFPPNPMEFRGLCTPQGEDLGLPGFSDAFRMAIGLIRPRHPAVYYTMMTMGTDEAHKLKTRDTADEAEARFRKHWQATIEHVAAGGELPEVPEEIEHKPARAPKEIAIKTMDSLKEMFS